MNSEKNTSQEDSTSIILLLDKGLVIPENLAKSIRLQVEAEIPKLMPGVPYKAKQLCGKPFWLQLSKGDRLAAGKYIANLVAKNQLPLTRIEGGHEYPYKYIRK